MVPVAAPENRLGKPSGCSALGFHAILCTGLLECGVVRELALGSEALYHDQCYQNPSEQARLGSVARLWDQAKHWKVFGLVLKL